MMVLPVAYVLDCLLGDPPHWPHPVRFIGQFVQHCEDWLYPRSESNSQSFILRGGLLVVAVVGLTYGVSWAGLTLLGQVHPLLRQLAASYLAYTCLSAKGLAQAAAAVALPLEAKELSEARNALSMIVGRETDQLSEGEIVRGTVETVSENFSDGVVAPLFFLAIGGVPMAMAYKAVNTLDSMIGYQNQRYQLFGRVAARLDDAANWIPARLSAVLLSVAASVTGHNWKHALRMAKRDGRNHKSPNAGWPEAAVAGALGVRLGGTNRYFGMPVEKPTIGDPINPLGVEHIWQGIRLLHAGTAITVILFTLVGLAWGRSW